MIMKMNMVSALLILHNIPISSKKKLYVSYVWQTNAWLLYHFVNKQLRNLSIHSQFGHLLLQLWLNFAEIDLVSILIAQIKNNNLECSFWDLESSTKCAIPFVHFELTMMHLIWCFLWLKGKDNISQGINRLHQDISLPRHLPN